MVLYISHALRVRGIKMSVDKSMSYVTAWFIEVGSGVVLVKKCSHSTVVFVMVLVTCRFKGQRGSVVMRATMSNLSTHLMSVY